MRAGWKRATQVVRGLAENVRGVAKDALTWLRGKHTDAFPWRGVDPLEPRTLLSGSISGTLYNDINANAAKGSGEPGLASAVVYLDANNNGSLDSGETNITTSADGTFQFDNVDAGNYIVRQVLGSGWTQTAPSSNAGRSAAVVDNETTSGIDFGSRFVKIVDDGDASYSHTGSWINYGAGYQGDEKYIATGNGSAVAYWNFTNLEPGIYQVAATWPVYSNQPTNANYQLTDVDESRSLGNAYVNQALSPASSSQPSGGFSESGINWAYLGSPVTLEGANLRVSLSNAANATYMAADAVRIVRVGDLPEEPTSQAQVVVGNAAVTSGTSTVAFGSTPINQGVAKTVTITNTGTGDLTLGDPSIGGANSSGFSIATGLGASTVAPGQSTTFVLLLNSGGASGTYSGTVSLTTNDPNHATFSFDVSGTVLTTSVIDNGDSGYSTVGSWTTYPAGYQGDEQYIVAGNGSATANWTFSNLASGKYRVSATWPAYNNQPADAPFTIKDSVRNITLAQTRVNQSVAPNDRNDWGAWWEDLATVSVDSGTIVVTLSNDASPIYLAADAVRLERVGDIDSPAAPILHVNDGKADVTSATTEAFGETSLGANISKTLTVTNTGFADLTLGTITLPSGFLASTPGSSTLIPGASTTFTLSLNGATPGSYSGEVSIASNAGTLTFNATGVVSAATIIDDGDAGYSTTGTWTNYGAGFRGDEQYAATGNGSATANWTFSNLAPGTYRVSATWPAYSNQSTNAVYAITDLNDGRVAGAAAVNQKLTPSGFSDLGGTWQDLATSVYVTGGSLKVTLSNQANGTYMAADAVRIERTGDLPTTAVATVQVLDCIVPVESGGAFDLGTTTLTSVKTKSLTIRNTGPADLTLGTLTLPSGFSVANAPSTPLAPGASTTLAIRLDGNVPGSHSGNLTLATNDPNVSSFQLALSGAVSPALVVDDGDANFTTTGSWVNYPAGYLGDEKYIATTAASGAPTATANWTFSDLPAGMYRISATWPAYSNQPANAPFAVRDGDNDILATALVDQSHAPGYVNGTTTVSDQGMTWQDLATAIVVNTDGSLKITLGNNATGTYMAADAVRIERVGDLEAPAPPMPTISGLPTNGTWHIGEEITLTAQPGENTPEGVTYEWLISEESEAPSEGFAPTGTASVWHLQSADTTLVFTPTSRAIYNIILTAKLGEVTVNTEVTPIEVVAPPEIVIVGPSDTDEAGNHGYEGGLVSFESVIANYYDQYEFTYHWLATFNGKVVAESDSRYLDMFPGEDGDYLVSLTIENIFGDSSTEQMAIVIGDTAPTLRMSAAGGAVGGLAIEGETFLLDLQASDFGNDTVSQWTIDWGDGSPPEVIGGEALASGEPIPHAFAEDGPYTITATAENEDGEFEAEPLEVEVANAAPTADFGLVTSPIEGGTAAAFIFANAHDSADDLAGLTFSVDFGDGVIEDVDAETLSITHQYSQSGNYTALGIISDAQGGTTQIPLNITVADSGPTVTLTGDSSASVGSTYSLNLTWADVSGDGVAKWIIDWGDGQTSTVAGARNMAGELLPATTATHTYLADSSGGQGSQYIITVKGKDDSGTYPSSASPALEKPVTVNTVAPTITATPVANLVLPNNGNAYYDILQGSHFNVQVDYSTSNFLLSDHWTWRADWGDGIVTTLGSGAQPFSDKFLSHQYQVTGDRTVKVWLESDAPVSQSAATSLRSNEQTFNVKVAAAPITPAAPTQLSVDNVATSTVTLSWTPPVGYKTSYYMVDFSLDGSNYMPESWGSGYIPNPTSNPASSGTVNILNILPSFYGITTVTQVWVRIRAVNEFGTSPPSSSVSFTPSASLTFYPVFTPTDDSLPAPTNLTLQTSQSGANDLQWTTNYSTSKPNFGVLNFVEVSDDNGVSWIIPSDQDWEFGYLVSPSSSAQDWRAPMVPAGSHADGTPIKRMYRARTAELADSSWYSYYMNGDTKISPPSNVVEYAPPPTTPGSLKAMSVGFDRIQLLWKDQASNDNGYEIQYTSATTTVGGESWPDWSQAATTSPTTPNTSSLLLIHNASGVSFAPNTTYYFRVRAKGAGATDSAWSNDVRAQDTPHATLGKIDLVSSASTLTVDYVSGLGYDKNQSQTLDGDDTGLSLDRTVTLTVPDYIDLSNAAISFAYSGTGLNAAPSSGLRLWKSDSSMRNSADHVAPGQSYSFADLGGNVATRAVTLYVQSLSAGANQTITANVALTNGGSSSDTETFTSNGFTFDFSVAEHGVPGNKIDLSGASDDLYILQSPHGEAVTIDLAGSLSVDTAQNREMLSWDVRDSQSGMVIHSGAFGTGWSGLALAPTVGNRDYIVNVGYGLAALAPPNVVYTMNVHVWALEATGSADFAFAGESSDISLGAFTTTSNADPAATFSTRTNWGDGSQGNTTVSGQTVHGSMTYGHRGPYVAVSEILVTAANYMKIGTFTASYVEVRDEIDRRRMESTTAHTVTGGVDSPVSLSIARVDHTDNAWVVSGSGDASYAFSQTFDVEGQSQADGFKRDEADGAVEFALSAVVTANLSPTSLGDLALTSSFSLSANGSSNTVVTSKTTAGSATVELILSGMETYSHARDGSQWAFQRDAANMSISGELLNFIPGSQAMLLDSIGINDEWTYNWGLANSGFYGQLMLAGTGATHESFAESPQVSGVRRIGRDTAILKAIETNPSGLRNPVTFDNWSTYTLAETGSNYSITSSESSTADYLRGQTNPALGTRHVKSSVSGGRNAQFDANANTISLSESTSGDLSVVETPTSTDPKKIRPNLDVREIISASQVGAGVITSPFTLSGTYSHGVTTHRDATAPLDTHERSTQGVVGTSKVTNSPFDPKQRSVSLAANSSTNASTTITDGDAISHSSVIATEYWTGSGDGSHKLDWTVTGTRNFHADTNVLTSAYTSFSNRGLNVQVVGHSNGDPASGDYHETITDTSDIVTAPNAVGLNNGTLVVRGQESGKLNVVTEQSGNALDGEYDVSIVDTSTITLTTTSDNRHVHTLSTQTDKANTNNHTFGNSLLGNYEGTSKIRGSRVVDSEITNQSLTTSSKEESSPNIDIAFNGDELGGYFFFESKDNSTVISTGKSANTGPDLTSGAPTLESSASNGTATRHITFTSQGNAVRGNVHERSVDKSTGTVVTTVNNQGRQFSTTTNISNPNLDTVLIGDRFNGNFNTKSTNKGASTVLSKSTNDTLMVSTSASETANVVTTGTAQIRTGVVTSNAPGYRVDAEGGGRFDRSVPFLYGTSAGGLVSEFTLSYDHTSIDKSTRASKTVTTNQSLASTRTETGTANASTRSVGSGVTGGISTFATDTGSVQSGITTTNQTSNSSTSLQENLNVTTKSDGNQISGLFTQTVDNHGSAIFDSQSANQGQNVTNHYVDMLHIKSDSEVDRLRGYDEFAVTEIGTERSGNSKTTNQTMTVTTTYVNTINSSRSGFNEQILGSYQFQTNQTEPGHVTTTTTNSPSTSTTIEHPTVYSGVERSGNRIQGGYEQSSYNYRNAVGGTGTGTNQNQSSTSAFQSFASVNVTDKGNDLFGDATLTETANGSSSTESTATNGTQTITSTVTTRESATPSMRTSIGNSINGAFTDTFNSPAVTSTATSKETNSVQAGYSVDATQISTAISSGGGTSNRITGDYNSTVTSSNSGTSVSDTFNQYRKLHSDSTFTPITPATTTHIGNNITGDFKIDGTTGVTQSISHSTENFDVPTPLIDLINLNNIDNSSKDDTTQTVISTHSGGNKVKGESSSTLTALSRSTTTSLAINQTAATRSTTTTVGTPTTTTTRNDITGVYDSKTATYTAQATSDSTQTNSSSATFLVSVHETGTHNRSSKSNGNLIASDYTTTAVDQGDMDVTRKIYNHSLVANGHGPSKITVTTTSSGHSIPGDFSTTSTTSGSASLVTTSTNRTENATVTDISVPSSTVTNTGNGISGSYTTVATDSPSNTLISKTTNQSIVTNSTVKTNYDTPSMTKTEGNHFIGQYELTQPLFTTSTTNDSIVTNSLVTSFSTSMHEVSSLATSSKASGNSVTGKLVARTTTQTPSSSTDSQYAAFGVTLTTHSDTTATPGVTVSNGNGRTGVQDKVITLSVSTTSLTSLETNVALLGFSIRKNLLTTREVSGTSSGNAAVGDQATSATSSAKTVQTVTTTRPSGDAIQTTVATSTIDEAPATSTSSGNDYDGNFVSSALNAVVDTVTDVVHTFSNAPNLTFNSHTVSRSTSSSYGSGNNYTGESNSTFEDLGSTSTTTSTHSNVADGVTITSVSTTVSASNPSTQTSSGNDIDGQYTSPAATSSGTSTTDTTETNSASPSYLLSTHEVTSYSSSQSQSGNSVTGDSTSAATDSSTSVTSSRLENLGRLVLSLATQTAAPSTAVTVQNDYTGDYTTTVASADSSSVSDTTETNAASPTLTITAHETASSHASQRRVGNSITSDYTLTAVGDSSSASTTNAVNQTQLVITKATSVSDPATAITTGNDLTTAYTTTVIDASSASTTDTTETNSASPTLLNVSRTIVTQTLNQFSTGNQTKGDATDHSVATDYVSVTTFTNVNNGEVIQGASSDQGTSTVDSIGNSLLGTFDSTTTEVYSHIADTTETNAATPALLIHDVRGGNRSSSVTEAGNQISAITTTNSYDTNSYSITRTIETGERDTTITGIVTGNQSVLNQISSAYIGSVSGTTGSYDSSSITTVNIYSDGAGGSGGSDTQTAIDTSNQAVTGSSNSITGVYSQTTKGDSTQTVTEDGTREETYHQTSKSDSTFTLFESGNSISADQTLTQSSKDHNEVHKTTSYASTGTTIKIDRTYDSSGFTKDTGNTLTGDYTASALGSSSLTTTETNTSKAGTFGYTQTSSLGSKQTQTGNSVQGDFTHSEEQSYSDTLTRTALNGDTFTQSVSDSPTIMTTGNSVAGLTTATQTGEMWYSFTQTTSAYELSGSGVKPYGVISHADANSGLADRTETGTDSYTLHQEGISGSKTYTLTVTGSDTYSLITNSNSQDGGFTQTLTATGTHTRNEHGDNSGTPYTLSDTDDHSFDQLQTGNDVDAQSTQTTSGETRYDLLIDFVNPVESVTTGEGVTLFMAIGAPQALIRDTMAPTGTMSDAGDIDHAYCFAKGTLVLMADENRKPIETIKPGEEVLAVDENDPDGKPQPRKVVQTYHNAPAQIWHVKINGETIRTTAGHPFYVKGKGWVKVAELCSGDELRDIDGKSQTVELVETTSAVEPVFNLHVRESRTYFVAAEITSPWVWVHNESSDKSNDIEDMAKQYGITVEIDEKAYYPVSAFDLSVKVNGKYVKGHSIVGPLATSANAERLRKHLLAEAVLDKLPWHHPLKIANATIPMVDMSGAAEHAAVGDIDGALEHAIPAAVGTIAMIPSPAGVGLKTAGITAQESRLFAVVTAASESRALKETGATAVEMTAKQAQINTNLKTSVALSQSLPEGNAVRGIGNTESIFGVLGGCFAAGTQVVTGQQDNADEHEVLHRERQDILKLAKKHIYLTRGIEELEHSDRVLARCEKNVEGKLEYRRIEEVIVRKAFHLQYVTVRSSTGVTQTLCTTNEHPVYVVNQGWTIVRDLKPGDRLVEPNGALASIKSVRYEEHPEGVSVYTLQIAEDHTFFVREQGTEVEPVWVHNASMLPPGVNAAEAEAIVADGLRVRTTREIGIVAPPDHHIFQQADEAWFSARGININNYTITIDEATHQALHYGGGPGKGGGWWNETLMKRLKEREAAVGRMLTPSEILEEGQWMLKKSGLQHLPIHPWNSTK